MSSVVFIAATSALTLSGNAREVLNQGHDAVRREPGFDGASVATEAECGSSMGSSSKTRQRVFRMYRIG
jgi:hypothetical protein